MKGIVWQEDNALYWQYDDETIRIEPFGADSLRVRATKRAKMPELDWALLPQEPRQTVVTIEKDSASITNGNITARIDAYSALRFTNGRGDVLLKEQWQTRADPKNHMSLMYYGRELKPIMSADLYQATVRFEPHDDEKLYGMGQRQIKYLDVKGCKFELAQRNTQASIPFVLSNKGYGFFWNNPGYGHAAFAKNYTEWRAEGTSLIDYWICAADTPAEIVEKYTAVVGRAPSFPEWAAGFWQCKLRYRTQEQLLEVAREYKKRALPVSVIVVDFFHWTQQGEWKFDPACFPDPKAMVDELHDMGIELMVSIWPTVDPRSENYAEMKEKGYLVRNDRGIRTQHTCLGAEVNYDTLHPGAREFVWGRVKQNYLDPYGIRMFWLDEAEPEYTLYDYDLYRHYLGSSVEVGNYYPVGYAQGFYEGMQKAGIGDVINLIRCAWAGSQRYGVVLWSGDVHSNFPTLRMQVAAGLNAGLSGIPWWTTDIGGFFGGDPREASFRELIVRWFQYGVFCPVFRLHGYRLPTGEGTEMVDSGLFDYDTNGPNEIWAFGEEAYPILKELLFLRERMRPYVMAAMEKAKHDGTPPMRPLFYDYPQDAAAWGVEDEFLFGESLLIAPVTEEGQRERTVYLPAGAVWTEVYTGQVFNGGQTVTCEAPLAHIPVFASDPALKAMFAEQ